MRLRHLLAVAAVFTVLAVAAPALAGLSEEYRDWAEGPVQFLMTKEERKQWEEIETDREAKEFIALFWARRNPDPAQAFNPFKAQFEARVRYADENFGTDDTRGALTDRARVLYLMGTPHYVERRGPTETVELMANTAAGTDEVRANAEMWQYDPAKLPEGFKAKGSRLLFTFYEEKAESNRFVLDRSHQQATMSNRALSRAPEVWLLHEDLDEVPKPVAIVGGEPADASSLAWLDAEAPPLQDEVRVRADVGVADADHRPVWMQLELPEDQPRLEALSGQVRDATGEVVGTFQVEPDAVTTPTGVAYHLTFPVEAGDYTFEVAGMAGGESQVVVSQELEVPPAPAEGTWMSPLFAGLTAEMEENAPLGQAYTFGGWHLRPISGAPVSKSSDLSFFGFVVRPGLDEEGTPALRAKVTLHRDGERLGRPLPLDLEAVQLLDDLYLYANALSLAALPGPGAYSLEFDVKDANSDAEIEEVVDLEIVE